MRKIARGGHGAAAHEVAPERRDDARRGARQQLGDAPEVALAHEDTAHDEARGHRRREGDELTETLLHGALVCFARAEDDVGVLEHGEREGALLGEAREGPRDARGRAEPRVQGRGQRASRGSSRRQLQPAIQATDSARDAWTAKSPSATIISCVFI